MNQPTMLVQVDTVKRKERAKNKKQHLKNSTHKNKDGVKTGNISKMYESELIKNEENEEKEKKIEKDEINDDKDAKESRMHKPQPVLSSGTFQLYEEDDDDNVVDDDDDDNEEHLKPAKSTLSIQSEHQYASPQ